MNKESDSQKLEMLYKLYEQKMYRAAYSVLHDVGQAEDAVQDAFIRLLKSIKKIKEIGSPECGAYVFRTIRNIAIDQYRRNQAENSHCIRGKRPEQADKHDEIDDVVKKVANQMILGEILDNLPEQYRDIVVYRCLHQLSVKEAAAVLEINEATVRKRQQRAMQKIKKMIGEEKYEYTGI